VGGKIQDAYRSGATKQQRGAIVGPLWEEARVALVGQPHPGSSNGVDAGSGSRGIEAADVDSALKARQRSHMAVRCFTCGSLHPEKAVCCWAP
jgi:hypothetical protein